MPITVKRAIEILDPTHREHYDELPDGMEQVNEACRMGMEALKRAIPHNTINAAIITYGEAAQVDMAIEEMSELTKALCKERRTDKAGGSLPPHQKALENVAEEIADVLIMLEQLMIIFCCEEDVRKEIEYKLNRLQQRLCGNE